MPPSTLVVHTGGIGDFLLACPAIVMVSRVGPVHLLGNPDRLALAVSAGIAEATFDISQVDFHTLFSTPTERLTKFLEPYDRAIVWMKDDEDIIAQGLNRLGIHDLVIAPGLPPKNWDQHASHYYLNSLGLPPTPPLTLKFPPVDNSFDVVIHPGSGSPEKNWPRSNFLQLAKSLGDLGKSVTWCGGPTEIENKDLEGLCTLTQTNLSHLGSSLSQSNLYIGNDSGITHLAAIVGCPTVAIFGPTNPTIWAPDSALVLAEESGNWPSLESVLHCCCGALERNGKT